MISIRAGCQIADGPAIASSPKPLSLTRYLFLGESGNVDVETVEAGKVNLGYAYEGTGFNFNPGFNLSGMQIAAGYEHAHIDQKEEHTQDVGQFFEKYYVAIGRFPPTEFSEFGAALSAGWSRLDLWAPFRDKHVDGGLFFSFHIFRGFTMSESLNVRLTGFAAAKTNGQDKAYSAGYGPVFFIRVTRWLLFTGSFLEEFSHIDFKFHGRETSSDDGIIQHTVQAGVIIEF